MNDQSLDQRLTAHAANYAASWRNSPPSYPPGFIPGDRVQFTADGISVEVFCVDHGMSDGTDGWDWRITGADGVTEKENGPEDRSALSFMAVLDAWVAFARLVRTAESGPEGEHESDDQATLAEALRTLAEKNIAADRGRKEKML